MAILKELYTTLKSLRDMNLPVDDKLLKAADNMEEKIITGGAIKLTRTMREREHTLVELARMEMVRNFLLDKCITDRDSFDDYRKEIN